VGTPLDPAGSLPQPDPAGGGAAPPREVLGIPRAAVGRLSLYLRELRQLADAGTAHVSSRKLGRLLGVSDAVVRRDLGYLGPSGRRGVGYAIGPLISQIRQTLGTHLVWNVALVGAGRLGDALMRYRGFDRQGFRLVAAFDIDPQRIGHSIGEVPVLPLDQLEQVIARRGVSLAILTVPAAAAQELAQRLASAGVAGILNFAPITLRVGGGTCVTNVDLASQMQQLSFAVSSQPRCDAPVPKMKPPRS
jgi:redox-sensing transcriptional repressor